MKQKELGIDARQVSGTMKLKFVRAETGQDGAGLLVTGRVKPSKGHGPSPVPVTYNTNLAQVKVGSKCTSLSLTPDHTAHLPIGTPVPPQKS